MGKAEMTTPTATAPNAPPVIYATAVIADDNHDVDITLPPANNPKIITHVTLPTTSSTQLDENQILELKDHGFTVGLAQTLATNNAKFPLRIWIVDNSGSMMKNDGNKILEYNNNGTGRRDCRMIPCSRWIEIQQTVETHIRLAGVLRAPTIFRLLNNPRLGAAGACQTFSVGQKGHDMIPHEIEQGIDIMKRTSPGGVTPLTRHLEDITRDVERWRPSLENEGKKVVIIIATDGLPTNDEGIVERKPFVRALQSLQRLPIWLVVRLCTDDDDVVEFYNNLDAQLEISIEVLDDLVGEATEIHEHNRWLNYTIALHRSREMGFDDRLFDLIDERRLLRSELRHFCCLLLGTGVMDGVPDADADWADFSSALKRLVMQEGKQFNPFKKEMRPLIDVDKLDEDIGDGGGCVIF